MGRAKGKRGPAAFERAAATSVWEELLPVLQVGWVHFEEGRATGVPRLQHVRRFELEGAEESREERSVSETLAWTRGTCGRTAGTWVEY